MPPRLRRRPARPVHQAPLLPAQGAVFAPHSPKSRSAPVSRPSSPALPPTTPPAPPATTPSSDQFSYESEVLQHHSRLPATPARQALYLLPPPPPAPPAREISNPKHPPQPAPPVGSVQVGPTWQDVVAALWALGAALPPKGVWELRTSSVQNSKTRACLLDYAASKVWSQKENGWAWLAVLGVSVNMHCRGWPRLRTQQHVHSVH